MNKTIIKMLSGIFLKLVKIPSPSGKEKRVAEFISAFLHQRGFDILVDQSGKKNASNTGNVIATLSGKGEKLLFAAHIDTVQLEDEIVKPTFDGVTFKSDGSSILGADNKASVAVLLTIAAVVSLEKKGRHDLRFVFTTREESGLMGSEFLDIKKLNPSMIFNVDGSSSIGTIDYSSLGHLSFLIEIEGKAAHAAIEPESGIHALTVATKLYTSLKMGKNKDGSTFNIGYIRGGENTNVVMPNLVMKGEIRAYTESTLKKMWSGVENLSSQVEKETGSKIKLKKGKLIPPFTGSKKSKIVALTKKSIVSNNIKFNLQAAPYTRDSSYLAQAAIPTITICKGGKHAHTNKESITLKEMYSLFKIIHHLCYHNNQ